MTRGLYNELIKTKDAVNRLQTALKNSALHALYQGHRADDAEVELSEQNETIGRLRAERDALLDTVKLAYRKHCTNDDRIGWEELGGILHTALCESLGDDGYCEWLKALEGGE